MRMFRMLLIAIFLIAGFTAGAQTISLSGTITDSSSQVWNSCSWSASIYSPSGAPMDGTTPVPTNTFGGSCSSTGVLTSAGQFYNTTTITPKGALYTINVCSNTTAPCTTMLLPVTSNIQFFAAVNATLALPSVAAFVGTIAYADSEVVTTPLVGSRYWNSTLGQIRYWNGTAWVADTGGGSSGISGLASGYIPLAGSATTLTQNSPLDYGVTTAGTITNTGAPYAQTNVGVFSNSTSQSYLTLNLGGCQPLATSYIAQNASYYNVQYKNNITTAGTFCTLDTAGNIGAATAGILAMSASNDGTTGTGASETAAALLWSFCLANNTRCFGENPIAQDVAGLTTGVVLAASEGDIQPYNPPSAYTSGVSYHAGLGNQNGNNGTYPFTAFQMGAGNPNGGTAFYQTGFLASTGSLGSASTAFVIQQIAPATSSVNSSPPTLLQYQEGYWNGTAATGQYWGINAVEGSGTNPSQDTLNLTNTGGPSGQLHALDLNNNIALELSSSTSQVFMESVPSLTTLLVHQTVAEPNPPVLPANTIMAAVNNSGTTRSDSLAYNGTPEFSAVGYGGSYTAPTAVGSGVQIAEYDAWAYNGSTLNGPLGAFRCFTNQAQTTSNGGTYCDIATTPNASTTYAQVLEFQADGGITTPGQTDKGAGTINAAGLYAASFTGTGTANSALTLTYTGTPASAPSTNQFQISPAVAVSTPWSLSPAAAPGTGVMYGTNASGVVQQSFTTAPVLSAVNTNSTQSTVSCSTSGTAVFSQPLQGASDKKVLIHMAACIGTASYTYPTAFTNTPSVYASNNVAASIATAVSTTAVTVTGATTTGSLFLEDY